VSLDGGVRLLLPPWSTLAGVVAATGSHEPHEQAFLSHVVRPGDTVVDVGANIGIHTVALAGLGAKVAAFEPGTEARSVLSRNIALNGAEGTVRVFPFALSDHDGAAILTTHLDGANHLAGDVDPSGPTERVELRTLDQVVDEPTGWFSDDPDVFLVKIDAEGHDEAVLRGAHRLLDRCKPLVMVETWDGGHRIRELLSSFGYRVFRYDLDVRRLVEYPDDWSGQANFIAVPGERREQVMTRLATAPVGTGRPPEIAWLSAY
jgi:FkbM family methyltransferase